MKILAPFFQFEDDFDSKVILKKIEKAGRTAYKSEHKITEKSANHFIKMLIDRGHHSVIEHHSISVKVICDRGVSHEIVRHRIASYTQESTRYCNYAKGKCGGEISVIKPCFWDQLKYPDNKKYAIWHKVIQQIEKAYILLIDAGATPQEARSILPNSLKTEIVITMNLREWRHFFKLRTSKMAHPQMREIAVPLLKEFQKRLPVIFDDIIAENYQT